MNLEHSRAVESGVMKNQLKTILLLGILSAILIGFGGMLGRGYVIGFTILALAMNLGAYFFSDKLVLRMHRAQPITERDAPRLHAIVRMGAVLGAFRLAPQGACSVMAPWPDARGRSLAIDSR